MRSVLLIAFQFPPFAGSSAVQRTLRFTQYLPEFGWQPVVLTAAERAYTVTTAKGVEEIPRSVHVERAFALDAARHLSIQGWYPKWAAIPDRWASWILGAVPAGMRLIRRFRPALIWSTYPVATTAVVGLSLQRLSGLPWVADFRDPMIDETFPVDRIGRAVHRVVERKVVRRCARAVFTTPGAVRMYQDRYPSLPRERMVLIENGYDEASFIKAQAKSGIPQERFKGRTLLHSGVIYPTERNPTALFGAIGDLARASVVTPESFKLVLRATGHDDYIAALVNEHDIAAFVELRPSVSYDHALAEMMNVDALVVLQGDDCEYQIPAKIYECLRAGKPLLGLVGEHTDTARVVRDAGLTYLAPLHSREKVRLVLQRFLSDLDAGRAEKPEASFVSRHERRNRTLELARLLDSLAGTSVV